MNKVKTRELLEKMGRYVPIYIIEQELKMPKNTLQKAISETEKRGLPKKWDKLLTDFVVLKRYITIEYLKKNGSISPPKVPNLDKNESNEPKGGKLSDFELYQRKKLGLK